MSLSLYMDVHVPYPVTAGLLSRGIDVLTAQWDEATRLMDPALLDRAGALGRVLVSHDEDLLAEAARRQREGLEFTGVICAHQQSIGVGEFIADLELMARALEPWQIEWNSCHFRN